MTVSMKKYIADGITEEIVKEFPVVEEAFRKYSECMKAWLSGFFVPRNGSNIKVEVMYSHPNLATALRSAQSHVDKEEVNRELSGRLVDLREDRSKIPVIAFSITSMNYLMEHELPSYIYYPIQYVDDSKKEIEMKRKDVPFQLQYTASIWTKSKSDMNYILQQILSQFAPTITFRVDNQEVNMLLESIVDTSALEAGNTAQYQLIRHDITFTMKQVWIKTNPIHVKSVISQKTSYTEDIIASMQDDLLVTITKPESNFIDISTEIAPAASLPDNRPTPTAPVPTEPDLVEVRYVQDTLNWLVNRYISSSGLCDSYADESGPVPPLYKPTAYTFDQALWAIAMCSIGMPVYAEAVLNSLKDLQNPDGSFCAGYSSIDRSIIFPDKDVGPIAWVIMAVNFYTLNTLNTQYISMACNAAAFLMANQGIDGSITIHPWVSVEENIDCYSALSYLSNATNDPQYNESAIRVFDFINSQWNDITGYFYQGLGDPQIAYDTNAWSYLTFGPTGPSNEQYVRGVDYAFNNLLVSTDTGIRNTQANSIYPGAFWLDPTLWVAITYLKIGNAQRASQYFGNVQNFKLGNGGLNLNDWKLRGQPGDPYPAPAWPLYPYAAIHPAAAAIFYLKTKQDISFNVFNPKIGMSQSVHGLTIPVLPA